MVMNMEKNNTKQEKQERMLNVERASGYDEESLQDILRLEQVCFPTEWQYDDANEYYRKILENPNNINIFLKEGGAAIGYALARLQDESLAEDMREHDENFPIDKNRYYIETIQVLPEKSGAGGAKKMLLTVCDEAKKVAITNFSIHARIVNGLDAKIKKMFGEGVTKIEKIDHWAPAQGEPYEYIEWGIAK